MGMRIEIALLMPTVVDHFFLDTNQWNYLCDPPAVRSESAGLLQQRLLSAVREDHIAVVSSVPVLEELMGTQRSNPAKYSEMSDLIFRVIGRRWLLPLDQRYVLEARHGGLLPEHLRYLPRSIRRRMRDAAARRETAQLIGNEVHAQVGNFKNDQEEIRKKLRIEVGTEGATRFRETINRWWNPEVVVPEWVGDLIGSAVAQGRVPSKARADREGAPSTWCFVSYKLARIKLNLAENRSIKESDYLDADHYSGGPYYDVLVTDDKALRETCGLIPDTPCALETFDEFVHRFA